jgi:DNA-binding PadR family transcriptional regulator
MSRFFRYGELPLVLLTLLERESLNGYELMGELERLFAPDYQPSAGSVYPALTALEAEELIEPVGDEVPKRYIVSETGIEALIDRRYKLAEIERRTGAFLVPRNDVERELDSLVQAVRASSGRADPEAVVKVLKRADKQVRALFNGNEGRKRS